MIEHPHIKIENSLVLLGKTTSLPVLIVLMTLLAPLTEWIDAPTVNSFKTYGWLTLVLCALVIFAFGFLALRKDLRLKRTSQFEDILLAILAVSGAISCFYASENRLFSQKMLIINFSALFYLVLSRVSVPRIWLKRIMLAFLSVGTIILFIGYAQIFTGNLSFYKNEQRLGSIFWDANIFARFLAIYGLLLLSLILFAQRMISTKAVFALSILLLATFLPLILTSSRSGLGVFFLGVCLLVWQAGKTKTVRVSMLVVVLLLAFIGFLALKEGKRFSNQEGLVTDASNLGRVFLIMGAVEMVQDNFFFGVGFGDFDQEYKKKYQPVIAKSYTSKLGLTSVHNTTLKVFTERGLFAVIAYVLWSAFLILKLYRQKEMDPLQNTFRLWTLSSLVVFFVFGQFYHTYLIEPIFWTMAYNYQLIKPPKDLVLSR